MVVRKIKFSKKEIPEISKKILDKVKKIKNKNARVVAFSGDLGAGKTTITQEIAKHLGIREKIISPTFVIMKSYKINPSSEYYSHFKKLIHIDAYRLDSHLDLLKLGWEELIVDKDNLVIIEWPERVSECIPTIATFALISHIDEGSREIEF